MKIRVGILLGGKSAEHEVSLQSGRNVIDAMDKSKYEAVILGLDKKGRWFLHDIDRYLENPDDPRLISLRESTEEVVLATGEAGAELIGKAGGASYGPLDAVFPVLHGTYGEDGTIQGLLKLANVPFVGAGVLGSVVGMDKEIMKRLLRDAGIPSSDFVTLYKHEPHPDFDSIAEKLGLPLFIKPANLGSSVGIHKVVTETEFSRGIVDAFRYDTKIIVESFVKGREIECAVLGNEEQIASVPGEIIPKHEFYSYEAKYIDEDGAQLCAPADLPVGTVHQIQELAVRTSKVLCCEGMARVDMFLTGSGELFVNEINTIPGFTKISMYPRLWALSGISYPDLIDRLIVLAIERFNRERSLRTTFAL